MEVELPPEALAMARRWPDLDRSEKRDLGRSLRRSGLSYSEIRAVIPVPKSTIANWCRDIRLDADQSDAIRRRTGSASRTGTSIDTQWRRRAEIAAIRAAAAEHAAQRFSDPVFVAGVSLYWGEGAKTVNDLSMTNADPRVLLSFITFVRAHLDPDARFSMSLNLHEGDDERRAREFWRLNLGLATAPFTKSYTKPAGTGHRKKHLPHGICRVRVRRGSDHWHRTMEWIDALAEHLAA